MLGRVENGKQIGVAEGGATAASVRDALACRLRTPSIGLIELRGIVAASLIMTTLCLVSAVHIILAAQDAIRNAAAESDERKG